jgi:hypothetical protein
MKTKNIENLTKTDFYDPVKEVTNIPRPIFAMAKDFPNGHHIPALLILTHFSGLKIY